MTTTDLFTAPGVALMDADEARLSAPERAQLTDLETTIAAGIRTFLIVGDALTEIRDRKLYRERHATFEAYCADRWQMSRSRAYQLITASAVAAEMPTTVDISDLNERQARELAKAPPEARPAALTRADELAGDGPRQAKHVAAAVAEQSTPAPPAGWVWRGNYLLRHETTGLITRHHADPASAISEAAGIERNRPTAPAPATHPCEHCGAAATDRRNLRGMLAWRCAACAEREATAQAAEIADAYPEAYPDATAIAALGIQLDRAEALGAIYDPLDQRADGRMPVLPPAGFSPAGQYVAYNAEELARSCDRWEGQSAPSAPPADLPPTLDEQDGARREAAGLVKRLAVLLPTIVTEDLPTLNDAIDALVEAPERGEVQAIIGVLWAYLDLEQDDTEEL